MKVGTPVTIRCLGSAFDGRTGVIREDRGGDLLPYGVRLDGKQTTQGGLIYCHEKELQEEWPPLGASGSATTQRLIADALKDQRL